MPALKSKFRIAFHLAVAAFLLPTLAAAEAEEDFSREADLAIEIQDRAAAASADGELRRAVHAKEHGCLVGSLDVDPARPASTKVGLFRDDASYPIWTRFSNGSPHKKADPFVDARGLAIKVLGTRRLEASTPTQDLLLINMQQPPGGTPEAFMDFMRASSRGTVATSVFLLKNPDVAAIWARAALHRVTSLAKETYFSVTPFGLGERAVKIVVTPSYEAPCAPFGSTRRLFDGRDVLAADLRRQAAAHPLCFDLSVQFQAEDVAQTPIEDAMVIWKTPLQRVARLILPAQEYSSPEQSEYCERLNFTPWHTLPEHPPLGRLNASRRQVYETSQEYRKRAGVLLPEPETLRSFPK